VGRLTRSHRGALATARAEMTRFARRGRLHRSSRLYYHECSVVRPERGNNSVVECDLAKVEVAGSNPVSRSNLRFRLQAKVELRLASQLPRPSMTTRRCRRT
jgi:hypothetical protein